MRRLRVIGRVSSVLGLAVVGVLGTPSPVFAECTFVPSLPRVSMAVGTAQELFVGEVVENGLWNDRPAGFIFTVRVDEVLRGAAKVGELREFSWVEPNWPMAKYGSAKPYPACTYLYGTVGETVVLALRARTSGGMIRDGAQSWYQPPTTFNTIGLAKGSARDPDAPYERQVLSLDRLRELAALPPPSTDATTTIGSSPSLSGPDPRLGIVAVVALLVGLARPLARRSR
jgi:hypothetical protein